MRPGSSILFQRGLLAAFLAAAAATLPAAELRFANGDRLTGTVVSRENGQIQFQTRALGLVTVAEVDAVVVEHDEEASAASVLAGLPPTREDPNTGPGPAAQPAAAKPVTAQTEGAIGRRPDAAPASRWRGKAEFGFQQQSGRRDKTDLNLRVEAERKSGRNQYRVASRLIYGEQNDLKSSDRHDTSFRWRHDLSPRLFAQTLTSYQSDQVKQIDHNVEQNIGVGYRIIDGERHTINVGGGVTAQYRISPATEDGMAYLGEVFQDFRLQVNGRITFTQDFAAFYSPESLSSRNLVNLGASDNASSDNYRLRFNSAVQGKVTDRISANIRYEFEHDATIANRDLRNDQRVTSSIGYAF